MVNAIKSEATRTYDNMLKSASSKNTVSAYKRVIPQFVEMMWGVEIKDLNADMLESITPNDVEERYINILKEDGLINTSIINYLNTVRTFINKLEANKIFQDVNYFYLKNSALSTSSLKKDGKRRSKLGLNHYEMFHEWLLDYKWSSRYEDKREKYALVLRFMFKTAVRIDSTFNNVHWKDFVYEEDINRNEGWVLYALDKGSKWNRKPINKDFYNELRELFYNGDDEELVFGELSKRKFTNLMAEFSKEINREFTPHSIKVGAGTALYNMTKNLLLVQSFLDHEDPKTTMAYIRIDDNMTQTGSYIMSSDINVEKVNELSYDDLVRIITRRKDLAYSILAEAEKEGLV